MKTEFEVVLTDGMRFVDIISFDTEEEARAFADGTFRLTKDGHAPKRFRFQVWSVCVGEDCEGVPMTMTYQTPWIDRETLEVAED